MNKENKKSIKGYKVFNSDWTCRGFQFEVGKVFEENVKPKCCEEGFHFCTIAADCFNYYRFDSNNKVAEVEALGEVDYNDEDSKCATNKLRIVREITWQELLTIVNTGKGCTGLGNTGDGNSGDRNTGSCNTGSYNTGYWNTGNRNTGNNNNGFCNSGNSNTGYRNTGYCNRGNYNSGNYNTGNYNSGDYNSGNYNSANYNSGDWNSGYYNSGNYNSGDWNSGNYNSGDYNSGNCNSGDHSSGSYNAGDWNKSNYNAGCFNTKEQNIYLFNKESDWTYRDWINSNARNILNQIPKNVTEWIYEKDMTDEEKKKNPTYKTTGGYLKVLDESDIVQIWWNGLNNKDKNIIMSIPNFDKDIFYECTGIKVE